MKISPSREIIKQYNAAAPAKAVLSGPNAAKTTASRLSPHGSRSLAALLGSLGLPADRLSGSIVSFARFFSLPLEPNFLANIRRQSNLPGQSPQTEQETEKAGRPAVLPAEADLFRNREALSLAATAAADKGVELSRAGLEDYAAAIDPDRRDTGGHETGGEDPGDTGNRGASGQNAGGKNRKDGSNAEIDAIIAGDSLGLKEKLLELGENNPMLDLLNRLPGKNGQRWIVLPFSIVEQGKLYRISLRILLDAGLSSGHLALEITAGPAGTDPAAPERRWLFALDRPKGDNPRLRLYLWPSAPPKTLKSLGQELAACVGLPPEGVFVQICAQIREESFPFAENSRENVLRSINEEV
jgi:hypothetical protein